MAAAVLVVLIFAVTAAHPEASLRGSNFEIDSDDP
jgi:hypothetical protein